MNHMHANTNPYETLLQIGIVLCIVLIVITVVLKLRRARILAYYWDEYWEAVTDRNEAEAQRLAEKYYGLLNAPLGIMKSKISNEDKQIIERQIASYKK